MTMPPASGMCWRSWRSRVSAAAMTAGIHSPAGFNAVRHARAVCSALSGSPPRLARVGQEDDGPDNTVGQCLGVAVGVIGLRAHQAVAGGFVVDERDRAV